ncbi:MAG TPA: hypothetical protein VL285_01460, partial [Bryobacteraceae bacterium]|nr:hypothetical protein [Bryobacteraceae bacterium]
LRTMVALSEMGAVLLPPVPAFYTKPETVMDIVDSSVDRALDLLQLPDRDCRRWQGSQVE